MRVAPEYRGRGGRFSERVAVHLTPEQAHAIWRIAAEESTTQAAVIRAALAEFLDENDESDHEVT